MDEIIGQVESMIKAAIESDTMIPNIGVMYRKLYISLIDAGFEEAEALTIVSNFKIK